MPVNPFFNLPFHFIALPKGTLKFLTVPFDKPHKSQKLKWMNQSAQTEYFLNLTGSFFEENEYSLYDINGGFVVNATYNTIKDYNYFMYRDEDYNNKRFYCFITRIIDNGDDTCTILYNIDTAQTWFYDGSQKRYLSQTPTGNIKIIAPSEVSVKPGDSLKFTAYFADSKHTSTLVEFRALSTVANMSITTDGFLVVKKEASVGTVMTVRAIDLYDNQDVRTTVTVISGEENP